MKQFFTYIIKLLILSCFTLLTGIIISGSFFNKFIESNVVFKRGAYGHSFSRFSELEEKIKNKENIDVLFLGSSHCYRGFDPRNFPEFNTFNFGSSAQTHIQTNYLLKRYLTQLQPKTAIYDVASIILQKDGVESSVDLLSNIHGIEKDIDMLYMIFEVNNPVVYNTYLYTYFRALFNVGNGYQEPQSKDQDTYIPGGYAEKELICYRRTEVIEPSTINIQAEQIAHLKENITLLQSRGVKVILVQIPVTSDLYNSVTNNDQLDSIYHSLGEYYNFNKLMNLNDTLDFFDKDHLNQNGVKKFNDALISLGLI